VGWTGRLAGGYDLAIASGPPLLLGLNAGPVDALDAVGALLHDAAGADRDVRVAQQAEAVGGVVGVLEEVEAADLVGTVVRAVTGADTAVVDHVVEALGAVDGGTDRADQLAGRLLAVHAGHWLVRDARVVGWTIEVGV